MWFCLVVRAGSHGEPDRHEDRDRHADGDNGTAHNLCAAGYADPDSGRGSADSTVHASPDDACGTARAARVHGASWLLPAQ